MNKKSKTGMSRRHLVAGGAAILAMPFVSRPGHSQSAQRVVLPTYGGVYEDWMKEAFAEPFTRETGIQVVFSGAVDFARLRAQVLNNNVEWDVFEAAGSWFPAGSKLGLFEPLDPSIFKETDLITGQNRDYAPFYRWVAGIAWNESRRKASTAPKAFAELWDVKRFPGRRTLRNRADMVLELALVADGVDPAQLYPLDVDRAFRSLERIKPAISKWAESTSQLVTLLTTNEVDFGYNYTGRVKATLGTAVPLGMSLEQTLVGFENIGVVKGTRRKEAAMRFVAFALRPDRQAAFCNLISYLPGNPRAMPLINAETQRWLPDLATGKHIVQNDEWWASRTEQVQLRFQEFMLS